MGIQIEIGKSYIDSEPYLEGEPSFTDIISIVGNVLPGTVEYENGYRFFSQEGICYTDDGETHLECDCGSTHSVGRQLTPKDLEDGHVERYRLDIKTCENNPNYIGKSDSRFSLTLGNVYVNRMGFLVLLDSIHHRSDGEFGFAPSGPFPWISDEDTASVLGDSMYDLIYQKMS